MGRDSLSHFGQMKQSDQTLTGSLLGYQFESRDRLNCALTHPSLEGAENYQRLEFLGDRVLGLVIAEALLERFPDEREGVLSRRLTNLVRREAIAAVAEGINLGAAIKMSGTAEGGGGRKNPAVLADVLEALIGAIFQEAGYDVARDVVRRLWQTSLDSDDLADKDAKSRLQEWAQGRGLEAPVYTEVGRQGPDHGPTFSIRAEVAGQGEATASGLSKQAAEQDAAAALLAQLSTEDTPS